MSYLFTYYLFVVHSFNPQEVENPTGYRIIQYTNESNILIVVNKNID